MEDRSINGASRSSIWLGIHASLVGLKHRYSEFYKRSQNAHQLFCLSQLLIVDNWLATTIYIKQELKKRNHL
jgi:hypothetical protein